MRVIYEISLEDMRNILAEKYEIDSSKIEFMGHGDLVFARIDVSETETPITTREYMDLFHPKKEAPAPEKKEPEPTDEEQESKYKLITNEMLQALIVGGLTIPQICEKYDLKDSKYSARLYKRAEKFRSEGASRGRRRHQEEAQTTEQGGDGSRMEVLPVPGMPQGV